jgi:hypothetical protein
MQKSRTIFIWDIHGCYDEFMFLLEKLKITKNDKVYLTWDFISKWPKSLEVLEFLFNNQEQFKSVIWNHEASFLDYHNWILNEEAVKQRNIKLYKKIKRRKELINFIENLPKSIEEKDFLLIHAWFTPEKKLLLWLEPEYNYNWFLSYTWRKKVIYWHYSIYWIQITNNTIWLDSWCIYWGYLTAYILETEDIIQQKSFKTYKKFKYATKWDKR